MLRASIHPCRLRRPEPLPLPETSLHSWNGRARPRNLAEVAQASDDMLVTAFINSIILTVGSEILLVTFDAMAVCAAAPTVALDAGHNFVVPHGRKP
jgi:hypothetical protein